MFMVGWYRTQVFETALPCAISKTVINLAVSQNTQLTMLYQLCPSRTGVFKPFSTRATIYILQIFVGRKKMF